MTTLAEAFASLPEPQQVEFVMTWFANRALSMMNDPVRERNKKLDELLTHPFAGALPQDHHGRLVKLCEKAKTL